MTKIITTRKNKINNNMRANIFLLLLILLLFCYNNIFANELTDDKSFFEIVNNVKRNIKSKITNKLMNTISKLSCRADNKLNSKKVDRCLEKNNKGHSRVSDPNFWAQVMRAAKLSKKAYEDFSKLKISGKKKRTTTSAHRILSNNKNNKNKKKKQSIYKHSGSQEIQIIHTFQEKHSADAIISVRAEDYKVPSFNEEMKKCDQVTDSKAMQKCSKKVKDGREVHWQEYVRRSEFKTWDRVSPPACVEVTVRGSQQLMDWIMNAAAVQGYMYPSGQRSLLQDHNSEAIKAMKEKKAKIHMGFRAQFLALLPKIDQSISKFADNIRKGHTKIKFFGHSLGGAVTQLLGLHFALKYKIRPEIYTFGSPRVGNPAWAQYSEQYVKHYRFKYVVDIVPELPPNRLLGKDIYRHSDFVHYGFALLPRDNTIRQNRHLSPFQVTCPGECSRSRADVKFIELCHSSDVAYSQASTFIWNWMKDSMIVPFSYFGERESNGNGNSKLLVALEKVYHSELDMKKAIYTLECYGAEVCELMRKYPGISYDKMYDCLKKVSKSVKSTTKTQQVIEISTRHANRLYKHNSPQYIKWFVLKELLLHATEGQTQKEAEDSLSKCLSPLVKAQYYSKFTPKDWLRAGGDPIAIQQQLDALK